MRAIAILVLAAGCGGAPPPADLGGLDLAATADLGAAADLAATDGAASRPDFPMLGKNSGRVLSPLHLVTVVAQNDTLGPALLDFSDRLANSAWLAAAAQDYGVGPATSARATGPAIAADPTQAEMIAYLQAVIAAGAPAPDGKSVYLLYLPDGIHVSGTLPFSAYHTPFPAAGQGLGDGFAVVSRGKPYGGGETQLGELTRVASHEIVEAATDPTWMSWSLPLPPASPWQGSVWQVYQVPGPIENGDLCEGSRWFEAGDAYQRFFSNRAAAAGGDPCVPAIASGYFNATAAVEWIAAAPGQTVSFDVTGWSPSPVQDWLAIAVVARSTPGLSPLAGAPLAMSSPLGQEQKPCLGVGLNQGLSATVSFTVPAVAVSGDSAVIQIESFRVDPNTCYPAPSGDQFHFWLVGVYVP